MMLSIFADSRHCASVHLIGFEVPEDGPKAPLLAHLFINTDENIICVMPQDPTVYAGRRRRDAIARPSKWEWQHDHYAITGTRAFTNRLYKHMGWTPDLTYTVPAIPAPAGCVFPNLHAECGATASWKPEPLFFSLDAATSFCTATDLCPDHLPEEV